MSCPPCCFANVLSPTQSSYLNSQKSWQVIKDCFFFQESLKTSLTVLAETSLCLTTRQSTSRCEICNFYRNQLHLLLTRYFRYNRHVSKTMSILITQDNNVHFWKRLKVMAWLVCGLLLVVSCGIGGWLATNSSSQTKLNQTQETKPMKSIQS